jgi:hypothetical protein
MPDDYLDQYTAGMLRQPAPKKAKRGRYPEFRLPDGSRFEADYTAPSSCGR